jgi:PGF-pre-PGF domain-containing protein
MRNRFWILFFFVFILSYTFFSFAEKSNDEEEYISVIVKVNTENEIIDLTDKNTRISMFNSKHSKEENQIKDDSFLGVKVDKKVKKFKSFEGYTVKIPKSEYETLKKNPNIDFIQENKKMTIFLDNAIPNINAQKVWDIQIDSTNISGGKNSVCVIDTGVYSSHPALAGKVIAEKCYCDGGCCFGGTDEEDDATDDNGHGTHVAGIIASTHSTYKGVAYGTNIVAVKSLDNNGNAKTMSDIINGIEWCSDPVNRDLYNITVISLSFGTPCSGDTKEYCSNISCDNKNPFLSAAINYSTQNGIMVIAASGNEYSDGYISAPACLENAYSVGSINTFNSNEIVDHANIAENLNILAPGKDINSTYHTTLFKSLSGTSMATPFVSGTVALIKQTSKLLGFNYFGRDEFIYLLEKTKTNVTTDRIENGNFYKLDAYDSIHYLVNAVLNTSPSLELVSSEDINYVIGVNESVFFNYTTHHEYNNITECLFEFNEETNHSMNKIGTGNNVSCWYNTTIPSEGNYTYRVCVNDSKNNINCTKAGNINVSGFHCNIEFVEPTPIDEFQTRHYWHLINATIIEPLFNISLCNLTIKDSNNKSNNYSMSLVEFNENNYYCQYNFTINYSSIYEYKVCIKDINNNTDCSESRVLNVSNLSPFFVNILPSEKNLIFDEGDIINFNISFIDFDDDNLNINWYKNYSLHIGNGININNSFNNLNIEFDNTWRDNNTLYVNVSDDYSTINTSWDIYINNPPKQIKNFEDDWWYENVNFQTEEKQYIELNLTNYFTDYNNDTLTYTLETTNPNIKYSINSNIMRIWSEIGYSGEENISIKADDGRKVTEGNNFSVLITKDYDEDGYEHLIFGGQDCNDFNDSIYIDANCTRQGFFENTSKYNETCVCVGGTPKMSNFFNETLPVNKNLDVNEGDLLNFNFSFNNYEYEELEINWIKNQNINLGNGTKFSENVNKYNFSVNESWRNNNTLLVLISDGTQTTNTSWNLSVNNPPEQIENIEDQWWYENVENDTEYKQYVEINLSNYFIDYNNDTLTYTLETSNSNIKYALNSDIMKIWSEVGFSGSVSVFIKVEDEYFLTKSNNFTVSIVHDYDDDGHNITLFNGTDCNDEDSSIYVDASCTRVGYVSGTSYYDINCNCIGGDAAQTGGGSSGGGGGSFSIASLQESVTNVYNQILKNERYEKELEIKEIPILKYNFKTNKNIGKSEITIKEIKEVEQFEKESLIKSKYLYKSFEVELKEIKDEDFNSVELTLAVDLQWLTENNIEEISLYRFSQNTWTKFETKIYGENQDSRFYKVEIPGFSKFVVGGDLKKIKINTEKPSTINNYEKNNENTNLSNISNNNETNLNNIDKKNDSIDFKIESIEKEENEKKPATHIEIIIQLMIGTIIAVWCAYLVHHFVFKTKNLEKSNSILKLEEYIEQRIIEGNHDEQIIDILRKSGWDDKIIHSEIEIVKRRMKR